MQISKDKVVSIDYTLTNPQGEVLDSSQGRQPLADLALAYETIKVQYAGYWAADDGKRVVL